MAGKNHLPYFKIRNKQAYTALYRFLCRKFRPSFKKKLPWHYLILQDPRFYLKFIRQKSKTHPYFLRLDICKFFPSVSHSVLLSEIRLNYQRLAEKAISRRFKKALKTDLPDFLKLSPLINKGLPLGSPLSHILAGIYLLKIDLSLPVPFLRFADDYLLFCKSNKQAEELLKNIILPKLDFLDLSVNGQKLSSGKFNRDRVNFLGFEFYAGYFRIMQEKIENFKRKIVKITHLTKNKPTKAVIKQLNNQILGFGHYYKLASAKKEFRELDSFIRMRLRRYIARNKDCKNKEGNLLLTNSTLEKAGLKSLLIIKEKYAQKKRHIYRKKEEKRRKNGIPNKNIFQFESNEIEFKYRQKLISNQLEKLTSLTKKLERKIVNLEKLLANKFK